MSKRAAKARATRHPSTDTDAHYQRALAAGMLQCRLLVRFESLERLQSYPFLRRGVCAGGHDAVTTMVADARGVVPFALAARPWCRRHAADGPMVCMLVRVGGVECVPAGGLCRLMHTPFDRSRRVDVLSVLNRCRAMF